MGLSKESKAVIGLLALVAGGIAIQITEWRGGHPIGSFAESFVAAALMISSPLLAIVVGVTTKDKIDSSDKFYKVSTLLGWAAGIVFLFVSIFLLHSIPGVSEALDRLSEISE